MLIRKRFRAARLDTAGFTLSETLVAVAIIGTLAAVVGTSMVGLRERSDAATLAKTLDGLNQAITAFRNDVGRYPSQLVYLTAPPPTNATDVCGVAIPELARSEWRGPYVARTIEASGIVASRGLIRNTTRREPAVPPPTFGTLFIDVQNVTRAIATDVEASLDGNASFTTGSIRWVEVGTNTANGTLSLAVPVNGC